MLLFVDLFTLANVTRTIHSERIARRMINIEKYNSVTCYNISKRHPNRTCTYGYARFVIIDLNRPARYNRKCIKVSCEWKPSSPKWHIATAEASLWNIHSHVRPTMSSGDVISGMSSWLFPHGLRIWTAPSCQKKSNPIQNSATNTPSKSLFPKEQNVWMTKLVCELKHNTFWRQERNLINSNYMCIN